MDIFFQEFFPLADHGTVKTHPGPAEAHSEAVKGSAVLGTVESYP
jgi:hypothetical protein